MSRYRDMLPINTTEHPVVHHVASCLRHRRYFHCSSYIAFPFISTRDIYRFHALICLPQSHGRSADNARDIDGSTHHTLGYTRLSACRIQVRSHSGSRVPGFQGLLAAGSCTRHGFGGFLDASSTQNHHDWVCLISVGMPFFPNATFIMPVLRFGARQAQAWMVPGTLGVGSING